MDGPNHLVANQSVGLVDLVDRLLHKGVVISGDATVSLAGVDLVYLRLSLLLSSVQRLSEEGVMLNSTSPARLPMAPRPSDTASPTASPQSGQDYLGAAERLVSSGMIAREDKESIANPENGANEAKDLGRLVLTLVDLLRRVLERQALRRMEGDGISDEDMERMGLALMELDARMTELCEAFGLTRDELDIDLGPLGKINT